MGRVGWVWPACLDNEEFRDTWAEWLEYKGKSYKPQGQKAQLTRISKWGLQRAISAISYSMAQGYRGIFEDRGSVDQEASQASERHIRSRQSEWRRNLIPASDDGTEGFSSYLGEFHRRLGEKDHG